MRVAIKINDQICCPKCKKLLDGRTKDYKIAEINNKKYFEFIRVCNQCNKSFGYLSDTYFEGRYTYEEVKNIK
ncbi:MULTISPECIES: hypothetical protein [unclassified Clostridium]|uniref:hypothetical protein n=1 Tax=unclassified Clostridium TaxID=2614128 RepID=UPI0025BCB0FF|nr:MULTISPECIES: hypothetical protein [unclassified Clostridium]